MWQKVKKVKVRVYSPDIDSRFSGLYINYTQVLELTLSQSQLPGKNAAQFSAAVAFHTLFYLVPMTSGWTEALWS